MLKIHLIFPTTCCLMDFYFGIAWETRLVCTIPTSTCVSVLMLLLLFLLLFGLLFALLISLQNISILLFFLPFPYNYIGYLTERERESEGEFVIVQFCSNECNALKLKSCLRSFVVVTVNNFPPPRKFVLIWSKWRIYYIHTQQRNIS